MSKLPDGVGEWCKRGGVGVDPDRSEAAVEEWPYSKKATLEEDDETVAGVFISF
jgi:hypothetical protein